MKRFLGVITSLVFIVTLTTTTFADDKVDFKDYYSTEVIIDKDKDAKKWIVADENKGELFTLEECNKELYVSAGKGLNVRSVPTTNSKPLDTLVYGESVSVIGKQIEEDNMWVLIEYNDNYAFVWSEFLTNDKPMLNPSISKYDDLQNESSSSQFSTSNMTYLGNYMCTAYEWTGSPCANGNYPTEGYTVACNSLPFGTQIYIEGYGYYVVEDRGGGGDHWVDIYMGDESTCYNFGVRYLDVYIVN